tara:strand:+ start:288 stop:947 length:660 start_codon:yes stop_codon:yes gene_type:complete
MERAKHLIKLLKSFSEWSIGGSSTQVTASSSEDFTEKCIKEAYPDAKIYKLGSQQHPDFMIVPSKYKIFIESFRKADKKSKITLGVLRKWEASESNKDKLRIARVEVKTGASVYTLNDTFPEPSIERDEIYVLLSLGEKRVYVTTSFTMAQNCHATPPVEERFENSKKTVAKFGKNLEDIWKGTGVSTAARPTYRIDKSYAHHEASAERISKIFSEAGF